MSQVDDGVFLFSSLEGLPDTYFSGYCFVGADFVCGEQGARQYTRATGNSIEAGEDGCYLVIRKRGLCHVIGTDFKGYKKLFYFQRDGVWAISNSIPRLATFLRGKGVGLTPRPAQLCGWYMKGKFGHQLSSFDTVISEIKLLPSFQHIEVHRDGLHFVSRPPRPRRAYDEALRHYLDVWVRRVEGVLADGRITLRVDLSGGRDSRAVFALFLHAMNRLGNQSPDNLVIQSSQKARYEADFRAAQSIAGHYRAPLNGEVRPSSLGSPLGVEESYARWRDLFLGQYGPVYFPGREISSTFIGFGGGGGAASRPVYKLMEPGEFLEKRARQIPSTDGLVREWIDDSLTAFSVLETSAPGAGSVHPMILIYREFRERFHAGRRGQTGVFIQPGGSLMVDCSAAMDQRLMEAEQLNFDIMENLVPGLSTFPYDSKEKIPSRLNLRSITKIELPSAPQPGNVYISPPDVGLDRRRASTAELLQMLSDDLDEYLTTSVTDLFPDWYVERAQTLLYKAIRNGGFERAKDGKPAFHLLLAAFMSASTRTH